MLRGILVTLFEDECVSISEGEFCTIPKGVLHHPVAEQECWVALVETEDTWHTGDVESDQTKTIEQQLH